MPSTYTTSLRLTLPATGELAGTWGTTVNAGVTSLAEAAIAGTAAVTMIDADYTLTAVNGAADQARNMFVTLTGTLSTARNVICPPVSKLYFVTNNTTGGYAITFKTLAGTGISVPNGQRAVVYCNGTDVLGGLTALDSLSLNGSLTLVGGTANGVLYLNGSKAVTSGSALTFNGTNLGIGTASPGYRLTVAGTAGAAVLNLLETGVRSWALRAGGAATNTFDISDLTAGQTRLTLDSSGNLGLGVTPSAWISNTKAAQIGSFLSAWTGSNGSANISFAAYEGVAINSYRYLTTGDAPTMYSQLTGAHRWYTAPSGTAGNAISFTQAMTLDASGNLGVGTVSPVGKLSVTNPGTGAVGFNAGTISSPNRGNLFYDTDGSGWDFRIGKLQSGVFTPQVTLNDSGNLGLGVTPTYKLDVYGTGSQTVAVRAATSGDARFYAECAGTNSGWMQYTRSLQALQWSANGATQHMTLDSSGNLGLGVTPSAWGGGGFRAFQVGPVSQFYDGGTGGYWLNNTYYNSGAKYIAAGEATQYLQAGGAHSWHTAPSGTAGNAISFTQAMTLDASGNLGLGVTPSATNAAFRAFEVGNFTFFSGAGGLSSYIDNNAFFNASGQYRYKNSGYAGEYAMFTSDGSHRWYTAPSGTAGNAITFTQAMTLDASGRLFVGTTSGGAGFNLSSGASQWFGMGAASASASYGAFYKGGTLTVVGLLGTDGGGIIGGGSGDNFGIRAENALLFMSGAAERARLTSSGNLGVGTASPTSTLHVSGSFSRGVPVTKTANFTLTDTENWVIVNNSTSSVTATLPAPSSFPGRELMFVARYATGGGNLVSASSNVVQPDGTVTNVIIPYDVSGRYKFSTIVSDGTNWVVMNRGIM